MQQEIKMSAKDIQVYRNVNLGTTGVLVQAASNASVSSGIQNPPIYMHGYTVWNTDTNPVVIKLYDKVTAPTVGTDAPVRTIPIPATSARDVEFNDPQPFYKGLGIGASKLPTDADTTAPTSSTCGIDLHYK